MPNFESWGRYPRGEQKLKTLFWASDFPVENGIGSLLPAGMGRSYGDVCLNHGNSLLLTRGLDRMLAFDETTGVLACEAGVTLAEILEFAVPRGWFLPVTPGTKFVTVGGAIANDVHGKNHHVAGTFGRYVKRFELLRSAGSRKICSPSENAEWYRATIAGLGLTGLIPWAEIQLKPIRSRRIRYEATKFHGLEEFVALSEANLHREYTVSWIDCVAREKNFARGIFMVGDHHDVEEERATPKEKKINFPLNLPAIALNRATVGAFNALYFHKQIGKKVSKLIDYEPFFYPLDAVLHWNRMYGKQGLLQFQCVVPYENGLEAIDGILKAIADSGLASFLAVLKVCGDVESPGMLSFPKKGITLALDFPIREEKTFALLDRLGAMTDEAGGRLYPAKDARMTGEQFRKFYPEWREFSTYMDERFSSSFWRRVME
ncbi:MAG TPA: FAD-binding oxidoreductase [Candidatus Koribacter sp.]|jgi:FAD/FMN-containing dehydrogenase